MLRMLGMVSVLLTREQSGAFLTLSCDDTFSIKHLLQ